VRRPARRRARRSSSCSSWPTAPVRRRRAGARRRAAAQRRLHVPPEVDVRGRAVPDAGAAGRYDRVDVVARDVPAGEVAGRPSSSRGCRRRCGARACRSPTPCPGG
jgi:hypothetical protein